MVYRQKNKLAILIVLLSFSSAHADQALRYFNNDKYELVNIIEVQKAHVVSKCLKAGKPSCQAWTVFTGKPVKESEKKIPLAGDPAAKYCWDVGAKNRILKSSDNKQYDFCVFEDGSMIDAWDLYYKHFPPPPPIK